MSFASLKWTVIALVVGVGAAIAMFSEMSRAGRFAQDGVKTNARVLETWSEESRGRRGRTSTDYYLSVSFQTLDGNRIKVDRRSISFSNYRSIRRGETIQITYSRGQPTELYVGHGEYNLGSIPAFAGLSAMCFAFLLWQCRGLIGLGVTSAGRAAAAHANSGDPAQQGVQDQRFDDAIARAVSQQASQPQTSVGPSPRRSSNFVGHQPRGAFGRRSA